MAVGCRIRGLPEKARAGEGGRPTDGIWAVVGWVELGWVGLGGLSKVPTVPTLCDSKK